MLASTVLPHAHVAIRGLASTMLGCSVLAFGLSGAAAQDYPVRPVHLIVPFTAGGPIDAVARMLARHLEKSLQQTVVVENKAGAGGTLGMAQVAAAKPDGHTLGINGNNHVLNPVLYKSMPFKQSDLVPVSTVVRAPLVLLASQRSGLQTMGDVARQRGLSYASAGAGTTGHLGMEQYAKLSGVPLLHIPYKGAAAAMADLISGEVQLFLSTVNSALPTWPAAGFAH